MTFMIYYITFFLFSADQSDALIIEFSSAWATARGARSKTGARADATSADFANIK